MNRDCVFCRIVARTEEASIVYEDDAVTAFLDVLPINPGHTLIVPKNHTAYLEGLDPADGARLFQTAQRIAAAIRASSLRCEAINLILNDGAEAGQRVFHTHLHVIPRVVGDGLGRRTDAYSPLRSEMDEIAGEIKKHLVVQER